MFCPDCGVESTRGLRYCQGCGRDLFTTGQLSDPQPKVVRTAGAAWAVALATTAITLIGLGVVFSIAQELMQPSRWGPIPQPTPDSHIPVALVMIAFGSMTIFGVVFLLIRLFMKLMHLPQDPSRRERRSAQISPDYRPHQLQPPPMHMPSVTEHTTRNFDPILQGQRRERE